jgi:NADH-quinone oxidoreductase subunit N
MAVVGFATLMTVAAVFYLQPLISYFYTMISASGY